MNLFLKILVTTIANMAFFYLIGSFMAWQFNPAEWGEVARSTIGILFSVLTFYFALILIIQH